MCGILGISSQSLVAKQLLEGLRRLEYRGYDSAGLGLWTEKGLKRVRAIGRMEQLEAVWTKHPEDGRAGIAHTRWATHGGVTLENTHPHGNDKVCVVQNGIVENMTILKEKAENWGARFESTTDAELFSVYLEHALSKQNHTRETLVQIVRDTFAPFRGSFAVLMMIHDYPNLLIALKQGHSPLAVGHGNGLTACGSDAVALSGLTSDVAYLDDEDLALLSPERIEIFSHNGPKTPEFAPNNFSDEVMDKGKFEHFMHKEIFEQPHIFETLNERYGQKEIMSTLPASLWQEVPFVRLTACGTALYAAKMAAFWFENWAGLPAIVDVASEMRHKVLFNTPGGLTLFISQSGETADTLAALSYAESRKQNTLAVLNMENSSMNRAADTTCFIHAGPEIGVASTKAFTAQLWVLMRLVIEAGIQRGTLDQAKAKALISDMEFLPRNIQETLQCEANIQKAARRLIHAPSVLYLGRGPFYPLALEGALKLKEISYIHAEGYAAGEIKHGPIALVEPGVPVIILAPSGPFLHKTASAIEEVLARGADALIITDQGGFDGLSDHQKPHALILPTAPEALTPFTQTVALQLLAYHVALLKGQNVDRPRNLAKSVTVE